MWLQIIPNDVMMFRGSRPFAAGQSFVARSSFPPNPQVMTGAIRTAVIRDSGTSFQDFGQRNISATLEEKIGLAPVRGKSVGSLGKLQLRGPFVCKISQTAEAEAIERLFPIPQGVVFDKEQQAYIILQPSKSARKDIHTHEDFDTWCPLIIEGQSKLPASEASER
ncbi:MAG: type III-B CRISPR module-associated Cmr3 family protein [Chloroflexota bacterium]